MTVERVLIRTITFDFVGYNEYKVYYLSKEGNIIGTSISYKQVDIRNN